MVFKCGDGQLSASNPPQLIAFSEHFTSFLFGVSPSRELLTAALYRVTPSSILFPFPV